MGDDVWLRRLAQHEIDQAQPLRRKSSSPKVCASTKQLANGLLKSTEFEISAGAVESRPH
jgi:hypothetical protein